MNKEKAMTSQRIHADKIAELLKAKGFDVKLDGGEYLFVVRVDGKPFSLPPYGAYSYSPEDVADNLAQRVAA